MGHLPKSFIVAITLGVLLTVASSLAFGWLDGRWANQPDMESIANKLLDIPEQFRGWSMVEEQPLAENAMQILRCYGSSVRVYQNSETGEQVTVAVLLGPRGPIAVHTPEICYSGQGVQAGGARQPVEITASGQTHRFWQVNMLSKVDQQPALEVLYAWSDGNPWQAAEQPRFWLTDRLYKLQLAGPPALKNQPSAGQKFLQAYLEHLQPQLVPAESNLFTRLLAN